jgi:hypothetical protein
MADFEIKPEASPNPQTWGDDLIQTHRRNKLREIATEYNSTAPVKRMINLDQP